MSANLGIVVRKPLTVADRIERDYAADLRARVGTRTLVNPDTQEGAGFFCKESGKLLRDSISYLDHINGKKRALLRATRCTCVPKELCAGARHVFSDCRTRAQSNALWACRCVWSGAR